MSFVERVGVIVLPLVSYQLAAVGAAFAVSSAVFATPDTWVSVALALSFSAASLVVLLHTAFPAPAYRVGALLSWVCLWAASVFFLADVDVVARFRFLVDICCGLTAAWPVLAIGLVVVLPRLDWKYEELNFDVV